MIRIQHKLSRSLSMGIMLLAAPIFMLALGIMYEQSRILIHQEVSESTNSLLNTTLHRVRTYMGICETAANSNAWLLEENFRPDSMRSVSNRIVRLNRDITSSTVYTVPNMFNEHGRAFSLSTVNLGDTVATYVDHDDDYFNKASYTIPINTGKACWVNPISEIIENEATHHEAVATYCRPLRQKDGRIVGVVTADISFSRMAKILNEGEQPYPHAYYMLLGADGRYLIHPDTTLQFRKTIFTDANPTQDMEIITLGHEMTAGKQGTIHVKTNGERYHVHYRPVPGTSWSLALVCPDSDAMESFYRLGYIIIALIIIGLLIILLLCHHVVNQAFLPMHKLIDITRKMAEGQYDEMIPLTRKRGGISKLQNCFALMQQLLKGRMKTLREHADKLQLRNEELRHAKQKAEDNVNRKRQFTHHITQLMRTPLNAVTGFTDVLDGYSADRSLVSDEQLEGITSILKSNVISMNRMILLLHDAMQADDNGNLQCTKNDEVSCNTISQEVIDHILGHFPHANILFESELPDTIRILTNRIFMLCVLIEPLYNAVKCSDGKHITLHLSQTESTVLFTIQDVGPGMPAALNELSYDPFAEIDNLQIGAGIGLPLAKYHAVSLGGNLTIDADYHDGCRVIVEMPK